MRKTTKSPGEKIVKDIKQATRKHYSSEEKIRIVLDGLRGENSIAELCRREWIVLRQGFWHQKLPKLSASSAHLVGLIMRRAGGDASVALRASYV